MSFVARYSASPSFVARMGARVLGLALVLGPCAAAAQNPEILVSNDQIVNLSGSSPSLRGVIQQLCAASGVQLRQYGAEDRAFAGSYQGVPMTELLPRLLRAESYAVGIKAGEAGAAPRIAWVRVMGASTGTPSSFVPAPIPPPAVVAPVADDANDADDDGEEPATAQLPPDQAATVLAALLRPAFLIEDEAARKQQVDKIVANLGQKPDTAALLENADIASVGRSLADYPMARAVFAEIQASTRDPAVQRRLNEIAGALNGTLASRPQPPAQ